MSKQIIKKNLSDADMFTGHKEVLTFENTAIEETETRQVKATPKQQPADFHSSFFTPELQEKVGKGLLEIKMQLFKEGVVDFDIKVSREGATILLKAVPAKPPKPGKVTK